MGGLPGITSPREDDKRYFIPNEYRLSTRYEIRHWLVHHLARAPRQLRNPTLPSSNPGGPPTPPGWATGYRHTLPVRDRRQPGFAPASRRTTMASAMTE
jgi:hypothetical protein